jgi:hypothetical protein
VGAVVEGGCVGGTGVLVGGGNVGGIDVGGTDVQVGGLVGMTGRKGTKRLCPARIVIEEPRQLASCNWGTETPNDWLKR